MQGAARAALEPLSGNSRSDPSAGAETKRPAEWAPGARDAPPPDPDTASPFDDDGIDDAVLLAAMRQFSQQRRDAAEAAGSTAADAAPPYPPVPPASRAAAPAAGASGGPARAGKRERVQTSRSVPAPKRARTQCSGANERCTSSGVDEAVVAAAAAAAAAVAAAAVAAAVAAA